MIKKCAGCKLEQCDPMPTGEVVAAFYANYRDPLARASVVRKNARRNIERMGGLGYAQTLLDVGCGNGDFVEIVRDFGIAGVIGYDPYSARFSSEDHLGVSWDWITLWGVLEHLTDPLVTLRELHGTLAPAGRIAMTTVSIETPIPYRHKPPEHTLYFTRDAIDSLAARSGFKVTRYEPYRMMQDADVYMDTLLRTMPDEYQRLVCHALPEYVEIPTNEVFVVLEKCQLR